MFTKEFFSRILHSFTYNCLTAKIYYEAEVGQVVAAKS